MGIRFDPLGAAGRVFLTASPEIVRRPQRDAPRPRAGAAEAWAQVQKTGRCKWVSDLAEIPEKYDVTNVYGDLGQTFASCVVANTNLAAFVVGTLVKGLGSDHIVSGTDALWTGSPQ